MKKLMGKGKKKEPAIADSYADDDDAEPTHPFTLRNGENVEESSSDPVGLSDEPTTGGGVPKLYRALYDYLGDDEDDLSFRAGQVICVSEDGPADSWW